MSEPVTNSGLRRKVSRRASPMAQNEMSPAKAMRVAIERAAERLAGLEATLSDFREESLSLAGVVEGLEKPHLICQTTGPGGAIGLAIWNMTAVSALVEHLITGRINPAGDTDRAPTATDGAILCELFNQIMLLFDEGLSRVVNAPEIRGYRQTAVFENGRAVAMFFDDMLFRQYRIGLNLGNAVDAAELRLLFPDENPDATRASAPNDSSWQRGWQQNVKLACVGVEAVLVRLDLPLDTVMKLEVGSTIRIPINSIGSVSIEGVDQRAVATGRLGQSNGFRAIRLSGLANRDGAASAPHPFDAAGPVATPPTVAQSPDPTPQIREDTKSVPAVS